MSEVAGMEFQLGVHVIRPKALSPDDQMTLWGVLHPGAHKNRRNGTTRSLAKAQGEWIGLQLDTRIHPSGYLLSCLSLRGAEPSEVALCSAQVSSGGGMVSADG